MNPRLAAISGPLRDSIFPLKEDELSIGREFSNRLAIDDGMVAPQHCAVTRDGERWTLRDLGSQTGTFVNGLPVKERPLVNGDQIAIGGSVFLFLQEEASEARPNPVERTRAWRRAHRRRGCGARTCGISTRRPCGVAYRRAACARSADAAEDQHGDRFGAQCRVAAVAVVGHDL